MQHLGRTMGTLVVIGAALVAFLVAPALVSPASASAVPLGSSTPQQWAYGAQKWVNVSVTLPNATYSSQAFFGWQVIYTATNTTLGGVQLEAQRTMAATFASRFCSPSCSSPTVLGILNISGWSKDAGFANLTALATVYENGSAVPAIGLENAQVQGAANLSEHLALTLPLGGAARTATSTFFAAGSTHASVALSPALGLVPLNLTVGSRWNSSSAYTASGGWDLAISYSHTPFTGAAATGALNANGSVTGNGTLGLQGQDTGTITLRNGQTVPALGITLSGPFDDHDGVILVPHDSDLFNGDDHLLGSHILGGETDFTSNVDVSIDGFHHLHVVAAASNFGSDDSSLPTDAAATAGPAPAASAAPTYVQAQPESVASAQSASSCLVSACPAGSAAGLFGGGVGFVVAVIGLVVLAAVGSVSVIEYRVWAKRRAGNRLDASRPAIVPPAGAYHEPPPAPLTPPAPETRPPPRSP